MSDNSNTHINTYNRIRSGRWKTDSGSIFTLDIKDGHVSGTFQTVRGAPTFDETFNVTGFTDGEFIGLVVLWNGYHSLTSWTGRYGQDERGEYIQCMWHLVRKYHNSDATAPTDEWDCFLSYHSLFYYKSG